MTRNRRLTRTRWVTRNGWIKGMRRAARARSAVLCVPAAAPAAAAQTGQPVHVSSSNRANGRSDAGPTLVLPGHCFLAPGAPPGPEPGTARAPRHRPA